MLDNRFIRITLNDGTCWDLPILPLAAYRAKDICHKMGLGYYNDMRDKHIDIYGQEFDKAFNDPNIILEWLSQSPPDWAGIGTYARRVTTVPKLVIDVSKGFEVIN